MTQTSEWACVTASKCAKKKLKHPNELASKFQNVQKMTQASERTCVTASRYIKKNDSNIRIN
jgi:hypothetical protein